VARVVASAAAGDHSTASFRSAPTATNSTSQPGGTAALSSPGAAFTATRGTRVARPTHHGSGGSPSRVRPRSVRRAGSTKAAATPARSTVRTSATSVRARSPTP